MAGAPQLGRGHRRRPRRHLLRRRPVRGDIFRGDLQRGTAELFIDAPDGRMAVGMAADVAHDLLFVAGGFTGQGYVYDTRTGATVASYQFGDPATSIINDVAVTRAAPGSPIRCRPSSTSCRSVAPGSRGTFRTLALSGPAADISGEFNLNGIQATADGKTLIVAHSANGSCTRSIRPPVPARPSPG